MQPIAAQTFIIEKLAAEISSIYTYHNVSHTRAVVHHAALIAEKEGVQRHDMELLLTAAAFHDAGFLEKSIGHEEVSCTYARQYLPNYGFEQHDIDAICELIMATKIPQTPKNHLAQVLCDADLDYLGRDDFKTISENLFLELQAYKEVKDREHWYSLQVWFLTKQMFFTNFSKANRSLKLAQNLEYAKTLCI